MLIPGISESLCPRCQSLLDGTLFLIIILIIVIFIRGASRGSSTQPETPSLPNTSFSTISSLRTSRARLAGLPGRLAGAPSRVEFEIDKT